MLSTAVSVAVYAASHADSSLALLLSAGCMPLAALGIFMAWSVLNRPKPNAMLMVLLGLLFVVTMPVISVRLVDASAAFSSSITGTVMGGLIALVLGGTAINKTRTTLVVVATLVAAGLFTLALFMNRYDFLASLVGMYPLYKNVTTDSDADHTLHSTDHFDGQDSKYAWLPPAPNMPPHALTTQKPPQPNHSKVSRPSAPTGRQWVPPTTTPLHVKTPVSKYVAISLFTWAVAILGIFVAFEYSVRGDPALRGFYIFGFIFAAPFALAGLITWLIYKSNRRR